MTKNLYKLFLIEDHPVMRRELRRLLEGQADLEVVGEAVSAEEALTLLQILKPHLLLVDLSLPGMSGLELIRQLQQERPELRYVVVSGHAGERYRQAALVAGARAFVSKDEPGAKVGMVREALQG